MSRYTHGLGAAAALGLVALAMYRHATALPRISSVAVLPIDNFSGDPAQNYYADGITDELITMLAKNSTLRVVSRTSVMQYKGVHRPLRDIARELGVDGVLEGSVARSGDQVHLNLQLIEAATDSHVWAESYDRDAKDAGPLPREVAQTIAKRLNSAVQTAPPQYVSPEAHDAYLRGRYLWFLGDNDEAGKYFKQATELQPDYALGWSGLANYYGAGAIEGDLDPEKTLAPQEEAARKSIALDDSLPEAHLAMGAAWFEQWDWARADAEVDRAIELNPDFAEAYHFRAKMREAMNRKQEAVDAEKKAAELDPFQRPWALTLAYLETRQYDAALKEGLQKLETSPQDQILLGIVSDTYRCEGRQKEAVETMEKEFLAGGGAASAAAVQSAFEQGGYGAVVRWQLAREQKRALKHYVSPVSLAYLYAQLGQREETLALLEKGYQEASPLLLWIQDDPAFDFLHGDKRYWAIIRRVGLPTEY